MDWLSVTLEKECAVKMCTRYTRYNGPAGVSYRCWEFAEFLSRHDLFVVTPIISSTFS